MENTEIARVFEEIADMLEISGGNSYKIRAYKHAALNIRELSKDLKDIYMGDEKNLRAIPGVGEHIAKKITELLETGKVKKHQELLKKISPQLLELMRVSGIGPKHLRVLHDKLKVNNLDDLEEACLGHKVRDLEGFGEKTEEKILVAVEEFRHFDKRMKLEPAEQCARAIIRHLKESKVKIDRIEAGGSLRRGRETIGDIDILVSTDKPEKVTERFISYPEAETVIASGPSKSSIFIKSGVQIDLRVVRDESFGAALVYFTGSKAHNVHIRKIAKFKGLKINEYGVFKGDKSIAGKEEEDIYRSIGLRYMPPEIREDRGEIEASSLNKLPELIELKDIKGDLHLHTDASDGRQTIVQMAEASRERGLKYIAITEHSKAVRVAHGLDEKELFRHIKKIERVDKKIEGIRILKGVEVDIGKDGALDLDDSLLKEMDVVIAAVHFRFDLDREKMTLRLLKAMENRYVNILAHPTGRLIGERKPSEIDFEVIFEEAASRNVAMELNAHYDKLDLNDIHCRQAKEFGVKVVISTDAHFVDGLDYMKYGITTARRGWLEKKDVLNTLECGEFLKSIKRS
ncbi:MAG: DNA polymerase/3'-5' exonuclease PolX [Candidatus Omnitrophica bacterium]|nr:DNA polymerase/3'-5' exonuclease PolX [Candidatus Omnitrophota bacterium]